MITWLPWNPHVTCHCQITKLVKRYIAIHFGKILPKKITLLFPPKIQVHVPYTPIQHKTDKSNLYLPQISSTHCHNMTKFMGHYLLNHIRSYLKCIHNKKIKNELNQ